MKTTLFRILIFLSVTNNLFAQISLLKDINTSAFNGGSNPNNFIAFGGFVYYTADDGVTGAELWKSDGVTVSQVKDIFPGESGSFPGPFIVVGGYLYFRANDGYNGAELWRTDGTTNGTVMVADINPGSNSSSPSNLTLINSSTLYFSADDGTNGIELWKTGTGTLSASMIADINSGAASSNPSSILLVSGTTVYFVASDASAGTELWKSDGTLTGTSRIADIISGSTGSYPTFLTLLGSTVIFSAYDASGQNELWKTNGTSVGTTLVADIFPGSSSSYPVNLVAMGGYVYFQANDGINGPELWRSDGSTTNIVANIYPGATGSLPAKLLVISSTLYFSATSDVAGTELYKTTGSGATLVADINPGGIYSSSPSSLTDISGSLYFTAYDETNGSELWKYNGVAASRVDIMPGALSSDPTGYTLIGTNVLFRANNGSGAELWKISMSGNTPTVVVDLVAGTSSSSPSLFTYDGNGVTYFSAYDGVSNCLYKTDGTTAGTARVKSGVSVSNLTMVGNYLYFRGSDGVDVELYRTDGTTTTKFDINPGAGSSQPSWLIALNNSTLIFSADDGTNGTELWKCVNGSAPTLLSNINTIAGVGSVPSEMALLGTTVIFQAYDASHGYELWKTDGTTTSMLSDIFPGATSSSPSHLTPAGSFVFFQAYSSPTGNELWKTDGVSASLVKDISVAGSSDPIGFTMAGSTVFFRANDGVNGVELWKTDGTAINTVLVKDINPAPGLGSGLTNFVSFNGKLYFDASTSANGSELWVSDGTSIGTTLFKDINGGSLSGHFLYPTVSGSSLFFVASDGSGNKVWITDGVRSCATISLPPFSGAITAGVTGLTTAGSKIYTSMIAQGYGTEPFVIDPSLVSLPVTTAITTQPADLTAIIGNSASLSVSVAGTNLSYQWQKNSIDITGANSSAYTIANAGAGDAAQYRCKISGVCGSVTSNQANLTVYAAAPTAQPSALIFPNRTESNIDLSFTAASGASGYLILRKLGSSPTDSPIAGTAYTPGSLLGTSTVVSSGIGLTFSDAGLTSNSNYYYTVFSFNGSGSIINYNTTSPLSGNTTTLAASPTSQPTNLVFTSRTENSITSSFTAASPAPSGYIVVRSTTSSVSPPVDGTAYASGTSIGSSTVVYIGSSTTFNDTGLSTGTNYFYQIFSVSGSGTSTNYLTISPLSGNYATLDIEPIAQPTSLSFSPVGVTILTGSFAPTAIPPVTGYLVVRNSVAPISTPVDGTTYTIGANLSGGDVVAYVGNNNSFSDSGLSAGTKYYYSVFAYNNAGGAINYRTSAPLTGNVTTLISDTNPPTISNSTSSTFVSGLPVTISANVTDGETGVQSVVLKYRSISGDGTFSTISMNGPSNNSWQSSIPANQVGEIGIEYTILATDSQNNVRTSNTFFALVSYADQSIPYTSFGSEQTNYRIISIPLNLSNNSADATFGANMGNYDNTKWRLFHYSNGSNLELSGSSSFKIGDGYWFIAKNQVTLPVGTGTAVGSVSATAPFVIDLVQGWNQIGNPYLFTVSWSDIQTASNNSLALKTYNGSWNSGDRLHKFEGGFVFAGQPTTLIIPVQKNAGIQSGRYAATLDNKQLSSLNSPNWEVSLKLKSGNLVYNLGGLGMRASAKDGYDDFDDYTPPRLTEYLELNHEKKFAGVHYSKDIVPSATNHIWNFAIDTDKNGVTEITWDNSYFGNEDGVELVLVDTESKVVVDMKSSAAYSFQSLTRNFKVVYGSPLFVKENSLPGELVINTVFPNPTSSSLAIGFTTPNYEGENVYNVRLLNSIGQQVNRIFSGGLKAGSHELIWDGKDEFGSSVAKGLYFVEVSSNKQTRISRIIVK